MEQQAANLTLELTVAEINVILTSISQRPYAEVSGLFSKIQTQAQSQLRPIEAPAEAAE